MNMDSSSLLLLLLFFGVAIAWWPSSTMMPFDTTTPYTSNSIIGDASCVSGKEFPSLTHVIDTTGSMGYTMYQLNDINQILMDRLSDQTPGYIRQYSVMEFNDPDIGPFYQTCSMGDFRSRIANLYAYGGGDCPELAMAGLAQALDKSPYGSLLIVMTDASAKDYDDVATLNLIYSLLESKKSKVLFLTFGYCYSTDDPAFLVYSDIARESYGHVFQNFYYGSGFQDVGDLLNFLLWLPVDSTSRLFSTDNYSGIYTYGFSVPDGLSALVVTTAGTISSLNLTRPSGDIATIKSIVSETWGSLFLVENPNSGDWIIDITAEGTFSLRIEGFTASNLTNTNISTTDICAKCGIGANCEEYLNFRVCFCKNGFQGDGYDCSDVDECSNYYSNPCYPNQCVNTYGSYYCECNPGYENSSGIGCTDTDECASRDLNSCSKFATCYNSIGSYYCECPSNYIGDGYYCEFNECTTDVCPSGTECIKSMGSYYCLDPCVEHTVLDQPWRSSNNFIYPDYYYYYYPYYYYYYYPYYYYDYYYAMCDSYLYGWYQFTGSGGIIIPETCPSQYACGTYYPMWLDGSHPRRVDGIVNRTACARAGDDCCYYSTNIQVKACPKGNYVYKIQGTPTCNLAYCTDPSTSIDSCSCTEDEECTLVDGRYSCQCKDIYKLTDLDSLRPVLTCGNQEIKASFKKCQLKSLNLNTENIHLIDDRCLGFQDHNDSSVISVISLLKAEVCGNQFIRDGNNIIYKNTIYLSLDTNSPIGGEDVASITYSCTYPADLVITLETSLNPFSSSTNITIEGVGKFLARIALYTNSSYDIPYEGSEVILTSKTILYVGATLEGGDAAQFNLVMKNCYVTPTKNYNDSTRYYIIRDSCASRQDSTINVIENGVSRFGKFSVQLFSYVRDYSVVYLHCEIHICDVRSEVCKPTCTGLRTYSNAKTIINTLGPIIKQDATSLASSDGTRNVGTLWASAIFLLAGHLFSLIST